MRNFLIIFVFFLATSTDFRDPKRKSIGICKTQVSYAAGYEEIIIGEDEDEDDDDSFGCEDSNDDGDNNYGCSETNEYDEDDGFRCAGGAEEGGDDEYSGIQCSDSVDDDDYSDDSHFGCSDWEADEELESCYQGCDSAHFTCVEQGIYPVQRCENKFRQCIKSCDDVYNES